MTYKVVLERYDEKKKRVILNEEIRTLFSARARAYSILGKNNGKFKVGIYKNDSKRMGEVHKNVYGKRYWYPESGGKYALYSNGSIGKKLR